MKVEIEVPDDVNVPDGHKLNVVWFAPRGESTTEFSATLRIEKTAEESTSESRS